MFRPPPISSRTYTLFPATSLSLSIIRGTGPTGSGKTTSLYAALKQLNDGQRNILTVEDPVEYAVDGVGQTQVNPKVGLDFAAGLRAILRQDPDVVMVGAILDAERFDLPLADTAIDPAQDDFVLGGGLWPPLAA